MGRWLSVATLVAVALGCALLHADVKDVSTIGFTSVNVARVAAVPARVYAALVGSVGDWWNPEHTYSHNAKNLSIDARPGGCFCEKFDNGGGVQHLTVVYAQPGRLLRMTGAMGPLQGLALQGTMTWELQADGAATTITLTYAVGGYRPGGFADLAPVVDGVVGEQMQRLKQFVETGKAGATAYQLMR